MGRCSRRSQGLCRCAVRSWVPYTMEEEDTRPREMVLSQFFDTGYYRAKHDQNHEYEESLHVAPCLYL